MNMAVELSAKDSISDKVARESGVLASGMTRGLFAAGENVYRDPGQTALQVASGVAVSALVSRASFLRLPALAITAVGGVDLLYSAKDFVEQASPAVAEIWNNPNVSKATTNKLESHITDATAAATTSAVSLILANKGFGALERSAPNNEFGRMIFGQKPVSLKYPRYSMSEPGSMFPALELKPFTQKDLGRLITVETKDMTYNAYAPGPFRTRAEADAIGQRTFVVPSRVYKIAGADTEVVVPEWLDKRFDQVRGLEQAVQSPLARLQPGKLAALKQELAQHPLNGLMKPEEVLAGLSALPDASFVPRINLSPYRLRAFEKHVLPKGAPMPTGPVKQSDIVGLAGLGEKQMYLNSRKIPALGSVREADHTVRHEWSHFNERLSDEYRNAFSAAAMIERGAFNLRQYASKNDRENQAVHMGEGILSAGNRSFRDTARYAPVRTAVMAVRLRQVLDAVPEENRGLFHAHYSARVKWLEDKVVPRAIKIVTSTAEQNNEAGKAAAGLLDYLKPTVPSD